MRNIRWGMIGTGSVTEVKSGPGFYKSENSELVGVYNRSIDKAHDWAQRHGVKKAYSSIEEMLADDSIDAVYIATPPNVHKEYSIKCIEAGKIPYIEKPMAMDYNECLEILKKSKEYNIPVYVAFYRRGMEKYLKIKELLDSGILGKLRYVEVRQIMKPEESDFAENQPWRVKSKITGGGKFIDMGVHVLDVLDFFFGNIVEVSGIAKNLEGLYDVEDTVSASFTFENGVVGNGMWCYVANHEEEYVKIVGEKGYILFEGLGYGQVTIVKNDTTEILEFISPDHVAQPYIQSVVNEILGIEKSNANIISAANVTRVTDEILKNFKEL